MRYPFFKLFPAFVALLLLNGCAVWTGGIPTSYDGKEKYPIVASVHGIKEISYSNDLHQIVISYIPTNVIILNTNTTHGFLIQIHPAEKPLYGTEFYVLPKAARWGISFGRVSSDQTTCKKDFVIPVGAKYISDAWGMLPDDPIGEYQIVIFLDNKLAADFRFRVIEKSGTAASSK